MSKKSRKVIDSKKISEVLNAKEKEMLGEAFEGMGGVVTVKPIHNMDGAFTKNKFITEVGSAPEHYKYIKNITKAEENMHKHIQEYKYFLQDQDLDREAKEIGSKYITMIGKFTHYLKTKWVKMIRKMI